ncbi:Nn.00g071310.m01.CDS01 [Neocucurbitaria sp. VM-36]
MAGLSRGTTCAIPLPQLAARSTFDMVYNWDDKEAECYRLYVEEKRSLDEVISYWEIRGFTPSKRAFQTQFKRWDFPSKQNPAHKNPALVARLRELWEQNYTQRDMVDTLQAEGFPINDRELIRLRLRLKLLLRESVPRPKRKQSTDGGIQKKKSKKQRAKTVPGNGLINQLANTILAEESSSEEESDEEPEAVQEQQQHEDSVQDHSPVLPELDTAPLSPEEVLRKQLRQEQLRVESDEKWRTRKRRRRTRGWAGLPADAPGEPPRFPSETTIDEAKAYLGLDNDMYREIRDRFLEICKAEGLVKKTIAGPEKWAQIVQQLIRENAHLSEVFQQEPEVLQHNDALFRPKGQRALSLDVICMDVTKRLRTMETRMTLADAKNALNLNPEQTRHVRSAFATKLKEDHFTNKHEAGEQHWTELKQAWVNESEFLVRALAQGEADPDYARKLKAVEVLARDVMKRQQQEKTAKDPSKKKQVHQGPGPGPAPPVVIPQSSILQGRSRQSRSSSAANATQTSQFTMPAMPSTSDLQIDPSLLLAASDAAILPISEYQPETHYQQQQQQHQLQLQHDRYRPAPQSQTRTQTSYTPHTQQYYPASPTQPMPLPIYFRLHPQSTTPFSNKTVWLSILHAPSVAEMRNLAMREHPGTIVHKLEGLITYRGEGQDKEVVVEVGNDEELGAYLGHVRGEGQGQGQGKATFVVLLGVESGGGYA